MVRPGPLRPAPRPHSDV